MPSTCAIKFARLGNAGLAGRMSNKRQKCKNYSPGKGGMIALWLSRQALESDLSSNSFLVPSRCVILGSLPKAFPTL